MDVFVDWVPSMAWAGQVVTTSGAILAAELAKLCDKHGDRKCLGAVLKSVLGSYSLKVV